MKKHAALLLPQAGGGLGWGLFYPPLDGAKLNRLAPTLTLPRLGGGNCSERFDRQERWVYLRKWALLLHGTTGGNSRVMVVPRPG